MDINKDTYSDAVERKIEAKTGVKIAGGWTQCFQTNTTYLDCPIADNTDNQTMNVVVQNPSSMETSFLRIAVPNGRYLVSVFDKTDYESIESQVACHVDLNANKT